MRMLRELSVAALMVAGVAAAPGAAAQGETAMVVPGFADFLAVDGESVWTTNRGRVEQWSLKGKLAEVKLTRPCGAMAIADGGLWVANCADATLNRIDVATATLTASIPTGIANQAQGELNVVAGAGSIWVASDPKGVVARVDPATNSVIAKIPVDSATSYLAFGFGAVWAVSLPQRSIQRIDPATNSVTARTGLGRDPGFLTAGEGAVWVQEQGDGTVARIDPESGKVTGRVKVGEVLKYGDIDTGGGKVWLRTTEGQEFAVIDPVSLSVVARKGKEAGSGALRYTGSGIWTSAHDLHTLTWWPNPVELSK